MPFWIHEMLEIIDELLFRLLEKNEYSISGLNSTVF